ncbi:hypothetical protein AHF37_05581 [Paragonimus kellicotti]|nr:hypothetical protein AHF37_05581 [Paragonimus kellicotti]
MKHYSDDFFWHRSRFFPVSNLSTVYILDYEVESSHSPSGDVQLTPRWRSVSVRPNEALVINFTFQSISDYPVDLYFLTDLSYTMSDDLETVSHLTNDIVLTMRNVTKKLQMGFGAFVDKPVFPFVVPTPEYLRNPCLNVGTKPLQCDPPFLFKHILSLTENFEEFKEKTQVTRALQPILFLSTMAAAWPSGCLGCLTFIFAFQCVASQAVNDNPACGRAKDCGECMGIDPRCSWCFDDEFDDTKEGPGYRCALFSVLADRGCPTSKIENVKSSPSGNLDSPEGGLDALLQVARCGDHIKWRANARKIVLFASDGGFHLAGDGRIAGLIRPPPTTCQLTYQADRFNSSLSYYGWHTADQTDYPSVGEASVISIFSIIILNLILSFMSCCLQIAQVLTEKDISVIFAVDSKLHALYTKLAAFLPSAAVGILSDSSTNIVRLLRDNYDKIANKAELMMTYDSDSLEVLLLTRCNHESSFSEKTVCNDHPVGGRIDYQISVKPKRCFAGKKTVSLKMVALEDQAVLQVEAACNCPTCQRLPTPDYPLPSARCQSRGYLQCGSCRCHTGFSGDFCECSAETSAGGDAAMIIQCTQEGAKEASPCSGRGRCTCGKCKCNLARYEGDYCECDRHGCKRASDDNQVCGGPQRGICQCDGTCVCKPGYTGDRCDCMKSVQQCIDPNNPTGPKCSGRGVCDCGQCFCNSGYTGHLCNEIQGGESALCTDREVERCVLCLRDSLVKAFDKYEAAGADDTSPPMDNAVTPAIQSNGEVVYVSPEYANAAAVCGSACNGTVIDTARVKLIDNNEQKDDSNLCIIYTDDSCRIFFTYRYSDAIYVNRKLHLPQLQVDLNIMRKSECAKTINILYIVLGVVAGIVLGGIILLLIYKLVITIDDRRELAKFEQQGENMRWEMAENPIFESPTTKVINPTYEESGY